MGCYTTVSALKSTEMGGSSSADGSDVAAHQLTPNRSVVDKFIAVQTSTEMIDAE